MHAFPLTPSRSMTGLKRARPLRAEEGRKVLSPVIEREGVKGKACTTCLQWKPLEKFGRHATCAGGRRNTCPACEGRQARRNDPEKCKANVRAYQARNPEKMKVHRANTHAKRRQLMGPHRGPSNITVADMRAIREVFGDACVYCGDPAKSLDHVIPLARGGEHAVGNLVPACLPCNKSKSDKLLTEWAGPPHKEL